MRRYRIFEPPGVSGRTEGALLLRDGFRFWALVLPSLWLLRHGLFGWALATFAAQALAGAAGTPLGALLGLSIGLLAALEGPSLRARRLRRRGWREADAVWARDRRDAELLYFAGAAADAPDAPWAEAVRPPAGPAPSPLRPGPSLFDLRSA
ncbi:DUF2628 domain-containing protein [Aureimonas flava]|uniref:DUF2628 domain-containing protein n=1 Tax=Aureimonas flava TaxID=2320271 RepID=A0A3A1WMG1_9HYPH|nr:DUF2628 domain-containing protein [Aureimonas flava]RIY02746.1 DUF2628 domain-containing protein [Aureimonas flava]